MSESWGRHGAGDWQSPRPIWTFVAIVIAISTAVAIGAYSYFSQWTPLQRLYFPSYVRSAVVAALVKSGHYRVLMAINSHGPHLAIDDEVEPVRGTSGELSFTLAAAARRLGDQRLVWQVHEYRHEPFHDWLAMEIYRDQTPMALLRSAFTGGAIVFILGLLVGIAKDATRKRQRKEGRRLKGPELVTRRRFNRRLNADGIGFVQRVGPLWQTIGCHPKVRIPRYREANHLLIMGDSGTGKSTLIRQILVQIERRGEIAIVYDPAREYTPQFYAPERGDIILNPLDARSPTWHPGDEIRHHAEARTLADSLFPTRAGDTPFFTDASRRIFAYLLTKRPTAEQLVDWLRRPDVIDRLVHDTTYAAMIDREAAAQRSGVLASLNMVADALQLIPPECETKRRWSATAWSDDRRGWLFLTSTPETRDALLPLTSLWLDTLVLRLMHEVVPGMPAVWFILDELASLQRLPQLHTAVTENRKSGNPIVLGFQGRSQLETRYGHDAEAMLSQPATKVFLGTSEPHAADWIAKTIGDIEIERLRESRSSGSWGTSRQSTNYGLERQVEPLVMASEIMGLPPFRGYLKFGNLVVRLSGSFFDRPTHHPGFMARPESTPTANASERADPVAAPKPAGPDDVPASAPVAASPNRDHTRFWA
jgi:type IV secretory pathway TraG/TraD family ATPase VirD4